MGRRQYTLEERVKQLEDIVLSLVTAENEKPDKNVVEFIERLSPEVDTGVKCCHCSNIGTHRIKSEYRDGTSHVSDEVYCYECGERVKSDIFYTCKEVQAISMVKNREE